MPYRYRRMQLERRIETLEQKLACASDPAATPGAPVPATEVVVACCAEHAPPPESAPLVLDGDTILLVGGRRGQVPFLAEVISSAGGTLLHHDGGREMSLSLLPGLVGRADRIVVALDCVSHAAAGAARRLVRDRGKALDALPSLSLNSLLNAVGRGPKPQA